MVSVVIPSYNRRESMLQLLDDLYRQTAVDFEVIVVDDNSADGTVEAITSKFPKTTIVPSAVNGGPCVARNRGIRLARGEIIVGLDSDVTVPDVGLLQKVETEFGKSPQVAALAFRILQPDGKLDDVDRWWHPMPIDTFAATRFATCYFSGTAYAFRTPAMLAAGLFPEIFFMHHEEVELSYRILDNGGSIMYCPGLVAIHHEHKVSRRSQARQFYRPRNEVLLAIDCFPVFRAVGYLAPRLAYGWLRSLADGSVGIFCRAIWAALKLAPRRYSDRRPLKPITWRRIAHLRKGSGV